MPSKQGFERITADMLHGFLESKDVVLSCNLCSRTEFSIPQVGASANMPVGMRLGTYANVFIDKSFYSSNADLHYIVLICKNCGNTIKINAGSVIKWVNDTYPLSNPEQHDGE